ncbi:hypothetical protein L195_g006301 [Trifolium pratense]|uniref:Uncharacterized protein n=1 Tax=Trifolium pratense TaxID=57577 RepID=A0A2K3P378_TRIPR|nr:hypothetical protein L195_g006301 [Trifolium pratense]
MIILRLQVDEEALHRVTMVGCSATREDEAMRGSIHVTMEAPSWLTTTSPLWGYVLGYEGYRL